MNIRIGNGFDVHKLVQNRKLILGGVEIPYDMGLEGHSDADALCHAIADSLLGALSLGDIGKFFPDTDEKYKNMNSLILLKEVYNKIKRMNYSLVNLDSTIICQKPKLAQYIDKMKDNIAVVLEVSSDLIGVKATTTEKLGFTGRSEGIAVIANVLVQELSQ